MMRSSTIILIISVFVFLQTPAFLLAGNAGLTIQPIKVSNTINPGETITGIINISNPTDQTLNIDTEVEDFVPAAGTANLKFVGRAEGVTTVRDWFSLDSDTYQIEPGENKKISYTIKAPDDAEPGSHFGVVFFTATEIDNTGTLRVGARVGVLFFISVPGNRLQKGKILDFSVPKFVQRGPVPFEIGFENTGTVHFEPLGSITITDIFGRTKGEIPINGQTVLPTGSRDLKVAWEVNGLLLGRYVAAVSIVDGEGNELTTESVAFYAFPLWYLLGFILTIAILFFVFRFLKRRLNISISINKQ